MELRDCLLSRNVAPDGAGLCVQEGFHNATEALSIQRCRFLSNSGFETMLGISLGGGAYISGVSAAPVRVRDCEFLGNWATFGGSALSLVNGGSLVVENSLLAGNAGADVLRAAQFAASLTLDRVTVADNSETLFLQTDSVTIRNSVIRANPGDLSPWNISEALISHSCVDGTHDWPGEGRIRDDPLFLAPGVYDFTRKATVEIDGKEY